MYSQLHYCLKPKLIKSKKSGIGHQIFISMFDFARTNNDRVRTRPAALPLMESDMLVDIKKYSFGVRVVEKIKLQKNIPHGKNLL
jgi:hypothetical protein